MMEILSESTPKAIKSHNCDACEHVLAEGIDGAGYTRPELRSLLKARKNKWLIVKGQKYISQNNKFDGRIYTFKAIPEIHEICIKYDLYQF